MSEQRARQAITDPAAFGRVAVLMGGWSAEREVSLISGRAVLQGLRNRGIDAHAIDVTRATIRQVTEGGYDRVFIALHGRGGEDGVIQGLLEACGIPYTGSGVLASALAMDKLRTKQIWISAGLPTPPFAVITGVADFAVAIDTLGLPLIVKPATEGSSLGMSKVESAAELEQAFAAAHEFGTEVFAERWIEGGEYTAAVLDDRVLPLIRIETPRVFYDYIAKYHANDTQYHCPAGLESTEEAQLAGLARRAFDAIGCSGWGRVDLIRDRRGHAWLIEVNTVPGMTGHSLVPMAARAAGIDFDELVWRVLAGSAESAAIRRVRHGNT